MWIRWIRIRNTAFNVLGIRDILVWSRIPGSDKWIWIQLLSSVTLEGCKKISFFVFFSYNLPAGTLSSVLKIKCFAKILC
jgi:hypothetical protein